MKARTERLILNLLGAVFLYGASYAVFGLWGPFMVSGWLLLKDQAL